MATVETSRRGVRTYGNWRQPTSPGLLGLGTVGTGLMFIALLIVIVVLFTTNILNAVITAAVFGGMILLLTIRDADGRSVLSRAANRAAWSSTKRRKANLYRSGPLGRSEWGTNQLPGLAAQSRLSEHEDSYARPFGMIYNPYAKTYSIVIGTEPDGAALVDQEQVDLWVADWGHWLRNLADEPGMEAAQVVIETAPDSGRRLRREVETYTDPEAPDFAKAMLGEVVMNYPAGSSTVKAYATLTFAAAPRKGAKPRTPDDMGRELAARIPGLVGSLQATGAGAANPLSAQQLCETILVAYDPAAATLIDDAHANGEVPDLSWSDVGPTAAQANWDSYRHDSATSITWQMTQAPRGLVQSGVLARLLAPHRDIARKRVTLLYKPIDPAKAAALVQADVRAAEFKATSTRKPAARDSLALRSAQATESEEASGAGLVNFGILVTATVIDPAKEADARAAVDNLGATARLRLRPVYGSQDSAFAAALPLGLVLTKHVSVPAALRERV